MKPNARRQRVSPLKDKPLRNPGQSLDKELQRLMDESLNTWLSIFLLPIIFTGYEWWRAVSSTSPQPLAALIVAIPVSSYAVFRLYRLRLQLRRLRMARDGEKAVGQCLSDLREKGYRVFHDDVGKGFNVDHVVICGSCNHSIGISIIQQNQSWLLLLPGTVSKSKHQQWDSGGL